MKTYYQKTHKCKYGKTFGFDLRDSYLENDDGYWYYSYIYYEKIDTMEHIDDELLADVEIEKKYDAIEYVDYMYQLFMEKHNCDE